MVARLSREPQLQTRLQRGRVQKTSIVGSFLFNLSITRKGSDLSKYCASFDTGCVDFYAPS